MTEPGWIDVPGPGVDLKALTWGPPDGPIALCLHGFPDTAYGWRKVAPRLVESGWRVVAPFMRGYAPSSIPADGSYHVGAMMDDALRVRLAAGGTEHDVVIGHDWGAIAATGLAAMPDSPFAKAVIMSVPPSAAFRPLGRVADRARLARQLPRQLLRSWYFFYFQLPWLPERSASWLLPLLWRRWSPGYRDADEDLRHVDAAIGTPESWRAALGPYRAHDSQHPAAGAVCRVEPVLDRGAHTAEPVPAWSRRRLHDIGFRALDRKGAAGRQRSCHRRTRRAFPAARTAGQGCRADTGVHRLTRLC